MSPRRTPEPESEALRQARTAGLNESCARLSVVLRGLHRADPSTLEQPETDFMRCYAAARSQAADFAQHLSAFGQATNHPASARPGGVKKLDRIVEKYSVDLRLPLDMLAGKVVVDSLWDLYDVASKLPESFRVVGYRDRVVRPQNSGYRDLQFTVEMGGHYAELKVMHRFIDELDEHEHRLYEIRQGLEAKRESRLFAPEAHAATPLLSIPVLSPIEQLTLDRLKATSADLFNGAWTLVLAAEQDPARRPT